MKRKLKERVTGLIGLAVIGVLIIISLYPVVWLVISSVKSPDEFSLYPVYALPRQICWDNYRLAWTTGKMNIFFKNSIIATFSALFCIICLSAPAAFALTKMKWKYSGKVQSYFLLGIMIPVQVVLIPLFIVFNKAHLVNSLSGLVLIYSAFGLSMSIFLFTGFFRTLPDELMEAAVIDGCGIYNIFIRVMLPLIGNAIVTVLTLQFLFTWNDLIWAQTFISKTDLKTVQVGLMMFSGEHGQREWGPTFASIVLGTLPTIGLYMFLSKFMIKGMTAGAVKG